MKRKKFISLKHFKNCFYKVLSSIHSVLFRCSYILFEHYNCVPINLEYFPMTYAHNYISFWITRQLHTVWESNFRSEHLRSTNTMQQRKKGRKYAKNNSYFSCDWASGLRKYLLWILYTSVSNNFQSHNIRNAFP